MDTRFPELRITSSFQSLGLRHIESLIRNSEIYRMGWNMQQLLDFIGDLQKILQNFERMTGNFMEFQIVIHQRHESDETRLVEVNEAAGEIHAYLKDGPEKIFEKALPDIGIRLTQIMLDHYNAGEAPLPGITFLKGDHEIDRLIEEGVNALWFFYTQDRGMEVEAESFGDKLTLVAAKLGREIMDRKIMAFALCRHCPLEKWIEGTIDITIAELREKITKVELDSREVSVWEIVGRLAMLAALAKQLGSPPAYVKAQVALSGEMGKRLAIIELLKEFTAEKDYPLSNTEYQLSRAIPGFNLLFNLLQGIFETYYNLVVIS
jgi:hypothetical protein